MNAQHTQGRLHVAGQDKVQLRSEKHQVAKAWSFAGKTGQENARLIAAAPELLAALRIAREHIQIDRNSFKEAHSFPDGFMEREDQSTLKQLDQKLAVIGAAIAKATGEQA